VLGRFAGVDRAALGLGNDRFHGLRSSSPRGEVAGGKLPPLEEAAVAYREALKERTRERVPLDWAATQDSLGSALVTLGEREKKTARLEEAVVRRVDRRRAVFFDSWGFPRTTGFDYFTFDKTKAGEGDNEQTLLEYHQTFLVAVPPR